MRRFGSSVKLEQFEDEDGLRFRATRERRLGALLVPVAIGLGFAYAWWHGAGNLSLLGAVIFLGVPVWNWFKVRVTELRVTELELVVEGDLSGASAVPWSHATSTLWLPWSEISGLQHLSSEGGTEGLYALQGLEGRVCLIPYIHHTQAGEIIHAIYSRFPYIAMVEAVEKPSQMN